MMKKFSILMLAIVAMLASCSQEDTLQTKAEDTLQAVTITAALPEVATLAPAATRAITATDDDDATRCLMQLVEEGVAQEVQEGTISNGSCSFTVTLNPTKQYQLMFWADNEKYTADAAQGLGKMTANASSANASPVGIAYAGTATWGGSELDAAINVDLKHVVGKLTLRTTTAVSAGKQYSLKIPATYTAYDVLAGELLEASPDGTTYSYTVPTGGVAAEGDLFSIYLLAGSETQNLTLTNDGADFEIANVPLAPNKHIILKGDVQNAGHVNVTFTATVVDEWNSEETIYLPPIDLDTYTETTLTVRGKTTIKGGQNKKLQIIVEPDTELTLQDVSISYEEGPTIICQGDAHITLSGKNKLSATSKSLYDPSNIHDLGSGIEMRSAGTLTIESEAESSLSITRETVDNGGLAIPYGAGIGLCSNANLIIKGGQFVVTGGSPTREGGANIGGIYHEKSVGTITIEGGKFTLQDKCMVSTLVGPGSYGTCGTVTIRAGVTINGTTYTEDHIGEIE